MKLSDDGQPGFARPSASLDVSASRAVATSFVAFDLRFRLPPAPRQVPLHIVATLFFFGANGIGFIFGNFFVLSVGVALVRGPTWGLFGSSVCFALCQLVAETPKVLRAMRRGELWTAGVQVQKVEKAKTEYHHTLTMLTDSGQTHEHIIRDTRRLSKLLDEPQEPILVMVGPNGRPTEVVPVDTLDFVRVSERGTWRLSGEAWVVIVLSVVIWVVWGVLQ